jgi:hypothetical protein
MAAGEAITVMDAEILTSLESCPRKALWQSQWEPRKLKPTEMVYRALKVALLETEREDVGELAGETVMTLAAERGLDSPHFLRYEICLHHASIADILAAHLRPMGSSAWRIPPDLENWQSRCYMSPGGAELRRVILVRDWDDYRLAAEYHSWRTLGEMVAYELPMTFYVMVLGQSKNDKRYSAWTQGLMHPRNMGLRFRKRDKHQKEFVDSWQKVWREDRAEITREKWLESMAKDGVLKELAFTREIQLPAPEKLKEIRADLKAQEREFGRIKGTPPRRYGVCDWPIPCQFNHNCWGEKTTEPNEKRFVRLSPPSPPAV